MSLELLRYEILENAIKLCNKCKHRNKEKGNACAAFPDRIPKDVLFEKLDHHFPIDGDHGIQFEPIEKPETVG